MRAHPRRFWIAAVVLSLGWNLLPGLAASQADSSSDWPMFQHDPTHSGVSSETVLGASTAASLSLRWQANTGSPSYTSPAVAFNTTLGKNVVYVGNQTGTFAAYDAATGNRLWYYKTGTKFQSSPAVSGNVVYFGATNFYLYALNATTGALICRFYAGGVISASPVVADPDGTGKVVYFGDNGLSGTDDGGDMYAVNAVDPNAAADCSLKWRFSSFGSPPGSQPLAGSWSPPAFGRDVNGRALVVIGSSSPDCAVYAFDAITGANVWRFQSQVFTQDNDVGAGPTISAPGVNGFADGVAYVAGKDRIVYALNLRTGAQIWAFSIRADSPSAPGATRSTAALLGNRLYVGYGSGVYALNAVTGAKVWKTQDLGTTTAEVISSPSISGAAGDQVLFVGDLNGKVYAFRLSDGRELWSYTTGAFVYSSAAISGGRMFITSSDGFLYAFGLGGGGASAPPDTSIAAPANGSTLPNTGSLALSGTATDDHGVSKVLVAVKDRNSTKWWNAATSTWVTVFTEDPAPLGSPGSASTTWSFSVPMPATGGVFFAQAEAVDADGQHDSQLPTTSFTVSSTGNPPDTAVTRPVFKQIYYFPNTTRQIFPITITGTATDTKGANPGVALVYVVVKNREHNEYYCGPSGCPAPGGGTIPWSPTYQVLQATLASPGATSTTWSYTFMTYDHPHSYYIAAWAVDRDGEADVTHAEVSRFCVNDSGDPFCA